jgi:ketosteroid isomerase-like protein
MHEPADLAHAYRLAPMLAACAALLAGCAAMSAPGRIDLAALQRQVADTERAFAQSMAARDHAAFQRFLSDEAVFFSGPTPLRGKAAVAAHWKRFYETPAAPFSWRPDDVQVLDSGTLALSTGPVSDAAGRCIARFTSIWRLEAPGVWRIVFDKGGPCAD